MYFNKDGHAVIISFSVKRLIEERRKFDLEPHIAFIDFEEAFVDRNNFWIIMINNGFLHTL